MKLANTGGGIHFVAKKNINYYLHPKYKSNRWNRDIALIFLGNDVRIPLPDRKENINVVNTICLNINPKFSIHDGAYIDVAGFGRKNESKGTAYYMTKMSARIAYRNMPIKFGSDPALSFNFINTESPYQMTCKVRMLHL